MRKEGIRYWFVDYVWRPKRVQPLHGPKDTWEHRNRVLDQHPLDWLADEIKKDQLDDKHIVFYKEISPARYEQMKKVLI
jgi:hypothetical protein